MSAMGGDSKHPKRGRSIEEEEREGEEDGSGAPKEESSGDEEDDFGPALPSSAPKKKRRKLPFEKLYVAALPASPRYSKSLMHKEPLSFVAFTPHTDFLITASVDGVVKFWKVVSEGVDFVKEFRAHLGEVRCISVSADGRNLATCGSDKTIKLFDVVTFDLLSILTLQDNARAVCWVHKRGVSMTLLAVSFDSSSKISIYDGRGEIAEPLHEVGNLHRSSVSLMAYNEIFDCVVSADESGMLEYWSPSKDFEKPDNVFGLKSSTNLFEFKKAKVVPTSMSISPTGKQFATLSLLDRKVRIFDFATGKLHRTYDESLSTTVEMQQAGTAISKVEDVDFGRRLAAERDVEQAGWLNKANVAFDETGNFIMYGSLYGIKVINTVTNRVVKLYGQEEPFRALNLTLYQGQPDRKGVVTVEMAASDNPLLREAEISDPILVATGLNKVRFYMFTNTEEITKSTRDIHNEKPRTIQVGEQPDSRQADSGTGAIIHTTYGDIHIRLFPEAAPKAVENFVTHTRNGYYNNIMFHRVIRKFMIQTGDPLGDGTGGESIWGREFEDEFSTLKHDKPYTVSMANAGPNTNGSQFFITTEKTPWLDNKHTIFGRAVQGLDVVHKIENARVYKERPEEEIRIISISIN